MVTAVLGAEEARFFARNGFLHLHGVVDAATCRHLVERTWRELPAHWRRDDPASWCGAFADSCHTADLASRGGLLKYQARDLATDPLVVASWQPPSPVHDLAHALVGRALHPIRVRGLYAIAPLPGTVRRPAAFSPHVEAHPANLVVLTYLDDVAPDGGGLRVWPGSHRELWHAFASKHEYVARPDLDAVIARWTAREPIELPGRAGDVVLTHHRLLHSPSLNRSRRIRFAFLCDYTVRDHQARSQEPPGADPWEDWPGLRRLAGAAALSAPSEFALPPASSARAKAWALVHRGLERLGLMTGLRRSERNKGDASMLARSKQPGDVWLSVSDVPTTFARNHTLDPQGGELAARGFGVALDGRPLASCTRGDFVARLPVGPGAHELHLTGITGPLWLRVLAIRLPFAASEVLLRTAIDGSRAELRLPFAVPAAAGASGG